MDVLDIHFEPDEYIRNLSGCTTTAGRNYESGCHSTLKFIIFDVPTSSLTTEESGYSV